MEVKNIISEIKEKLDKKGKHGIGGMWRLQAAISWCRGEDLGATTYTSNEFVHATPKELDERCIAVICSLKATPETVRAVEVANESGAITIAMTGSMETGWQRASMFVTYSNGETTRCTAIPTRPISADRLRAPSPDRGWEKYDKAMEAYSHIDAIIAEGKENVC